MKQFRIVETRDNGEVFKGEWQNCEDFTIEKINIIANIKEKSLEDKLIKDWKLEYKED